MSKISNTINWLYIASSLQSAGNSGIVRLSGAMKIGINKIHYPVTTLGYGQRICLWIQGCSIHCADCISKDTWDFDPVREIEVEELVFALSPWTREADGLTISGGEPFDQPDALLELLLLLRPLIAGDILIYSGYTHKFIKSRYHNIMNYIDVLIDGPFKPEAGQSLTLRGSDNQSIRLLSPLAKSRYPADINHHPWQGKRKVDLLIDGDTLWFAGIPEIGAMKNLREELVRRGLTYSTSDQFQLLVRA